MPSASVCRSLALKCTRPTIDAFVAGAAAVGQDRGLVDRVERDLIGIEHGIFCVVDDERMAGDRHGAQAVVMSVVADDLFGAVQDVDVAFGVARLARLGVARHAIGEHRDIIWRERGHAGWRRLRRRSDLTSRRDRRRRASAALYEDGLVLIEWIGRGRRNRQRCRARRAARTRRRIERRRPVSMRRESGRGQR